MEKFVRMLEEGNVEGAYSGFKKIYEEEKNIYALYYVAMIDLEYHLEADSKQLFRNFEILARCSEKEIREAVYPPLLSLCLENEDYEHAYAYAFRAFREEVGGYFVYLSYAKGLYYARKETSSEVEEYVEKALEEENLSFDLKDLAYRFLIEYYADNGFFEKGENLVRKLSLIYPRHDPIDFFALQIEIRKNYEHPSEEIIERVLEGEYRFDALVEMSDLYYDRGDYERCIRYLILIREMSEDKYALTRRIAICHILMKQYDEAVRILEKENIETNGDANYLIGESYYYKGYKQDFMRAIPYYLKAYELRKDANSLKSACDVLYEAGKTEKFKEYVDKLERTFPEDNYIHQLKVKYYRKIGDYDRAMKEIALSEKGGIARSNYFDEIYACAEKTRTSFKYYRKYLKNKSDCFAVLRAYYYGDYGYRISMKKVGKYLKIAEKEPEFNCLDSLIGTIVQEKDPVRAVAYFRRGAERYRNGTDACTCSIGCLCNALWRGIGVEKNTEEAFALAKRTIEENFFDVSENLGNVYAECALELDRDLEEVFDFLVRNRERRYSVSRLFTIIKVGKALGKEVSSYRRLFKKALKNAGQREKRYYRKNPSTFMMNSY